MAFLLQLRAAKTEDDVVAAAKDYLRVWEQVLHRLPKSCQLQVHDIDGVLSAADTLERFREQALRLEGTVSHELGMTAAFFSTAAARIRELQAPE